MVFAQRIARGAQRGGTRGARLRQTPWRAVAGMVIAAACVWPTPHLASADSGDPAALRLRCETGPCIDRYTGLPARVLTRPAGVLLDAAAENAGVVRGALPAFRPWFLFDRRGVGESPGGQAQGWYLVGQSPERAEGWLRAADAIPWRSALVVTYAYPGVDPATRRSPVLMFETLPALQRLASAADPASYAAELTAAVSAMDAESFAAAGLVSVEPRRFVDFRRGFYILPVLDYARLPLFDSEARLLRLAAAVPETETDLGRGATGLSDAAYLENAVAAPSVAGTGADALVVEMKFVIDMTASMQPQLDAVRRAMRQLTALLGADEARARLRYGLVGYTDVAEQCAGCPFELARDFFPDGAVGPDRLRATLADDPAARAGGGGDWPEAALEGVAKAIEGAWGENTLRFVVLIGDASANALGDGKGGRLSPESVRRQADAANVRIVALHAEQALGAAPTALQDAPAQNAPPQDAPAQDAPPSAAAAAEASLPPREDAAIARRQFSALALNPGQRSSSYLSIKVDPEQPAQVRQQYYDAVYGLAEQLSLALNAVRAGRVRLGGGQADRQADRDDRADAVPRARAAADAAFDAALISYLGAPAARPRDITFWALDVDPKDMVTPTLEVRVLLEKRELENLIRTLEAILEAFLRAKSIDGPTFFSQLQAAATSAALDSQLDYGTARSIAETGLLPRWLATLPYRSQIMSLTPERFSEMSADARDRLEQSILRKLFAYRDLYASDDWIALWPGADDFDQVYPVLLSDLP